MRWQGHRESENLEDRRLMRPRTMAVGGLGLLAILLVGACMGLDPRKLNQIIGNVQVGGPGAPGQVEERELTPEEEQTRDCAATLLGFTEEVWGDLFQRAGQRYEPPRMVLFSQGVETGCGLAPSAVGPFYCPVDRTVYLDPTFFDELEGRLGGSSAEFSQAYVIAHEIGHHVQNLLGYTDLVQQQQRSAFSQGEGNEWSVRLELQADYLAGVWAHHGQQKFGFMERGDINEAIRSANAIGDDRLQRRQTGGFVSPEGFTHGTSEQRVKWFRAGLESGDLSLLPEIFKMPYDEL